MAWCIGFFLDNLYVLFVMPFPSFSLYLSSCCLRPRDQHTDSWVAQHYGSAGSISMSLHADVSGCGWRRLRPRRQEVWVHRILLDPEFWPDGGLWLDIRGVREDGQKTFIVGPWWKYLALESLQEVLEEGGPDGPQAHPWISSWHASGGNLSSRLACRRVFDHEWACKVRPPHCWAADALGQEGVVPGGASLLISCFSRW